MARQSKSKARRKTSAWFQRHVHDPHVKRARAEGRRSRAAFKLMEILDRYELHLKPDAVVVDLGCAPGSWCEEVARRLDKNGLLIGIDLLPVKPIVGVTLIQADFDSETGRQSVEAALQGRSVDMVLSDMAPEMSGNKLVDQARMMDLNELTLNFAVNHLRQGGYLLLKTFMGEGFDAFRRELTGWFRSVRTVKPAASRKESSELFLLARDFRR